MGLGNEFFGDDLHILLARLRGLRASEFPRLLTETWWGEINPTGHYRPVALLVLGAERLAFGDHAALYRTVGFALHAACSVLAWRVLQQLGFGTAAFCAGLLFAVHPIHAEAVLTGYGQADLLAALAVLGGLERYVAFQRGAAGRTALWAAYGLFLLGLGCKESAVVLPALAVLTRGLLLRPGERGLARWVSSAEIGFALALLLYLVPRQLVVGHLLTPSELTPSHGFSLWLRVKTVIVVVAHDLRLVVAPWSQAVHRPEVAGRVASSATAEALWLALSFVGLSLASRIAVPERVIYAAGWFAVTIAPVAGVIPIPILVSERNLYLPALAPALLAALALEALRERAPRVAATALAILVLLGIGASWRVAWTWRTPVSVWAAAVERQPEDAMTRVWLGGAYLREARPAQGGVDPVALAGARSAFDAALRLAPDLEGALVGRATVAVFDGDCAGAAALLDRAGRDFTDSRLPRAEWLDAKGKLCLRDPGGASAKPAEDSREP